MGGASENPDTKLMEVQRLEMLGVAAAGLAHNLKNQLMVVLGNVEAVAEDVKSVPRAAAALANIRQAALQADEVCRQLQRCAGDVEQVDEPVNLSELIADMAAFFTISLPKGVALQIACTEHLPPVTGNPGKLRQMLLSLVIHSGLALGRDAGTVLLRTDSADLAGETLDLLPQAAGCQPGRFIMVEAGDTGPGIEPADLAEILQPSFAAKSGSRLIGLALAQEIARQHGGFVYAASIPGQGSVAQAYLPVESARLAPPATGDDQPQEAHPHEAAPSVPAPRPAILLIDDDRAIVHVVSQMLEKLGYAVITAHDGVVGVEKYMMNRNEIACIVLDLNMPYMNGAETLKSLRQSGCDKPVIIASGFSRLLITQEMRDLGISAFMEKPFTFDTLGKTLERVLTSSEAQYV